MVTLEINTVTGAVVNAAVKIHKALGPGLLEGAYEACLKYELEKAGLRVQSQVPLPIVYEAVKLDVGYRLDLLVENLVIVELKAVEAILPVHEAQLLSYLKLSDKKAGLLINFHTQFLKQGIKRMVNNL
jgi:GxxExxY protein